MKIRFSILSAMFCLFAICSWADTTTDSFEISSLELTRGGKAGVLTIGIASDAQNRYSTFAVDIYLPAGYTVVDSTVTKYDEETDTDIETIQPKVLKHTGGIMTDSHSLSFKFQEDGALRVTALSLSSAVLSSKTGALFDIYIQATPYAKPGFSDVQIKNAFFVKANATQFDTDNKTVSDKLSASESSSLPLTISSDNKWSTFISPFASAIPSGLKVYKYERLATDEDVVYVKQQSKIEAYTPYVIYAENGYTGTLSGTAGDTEYQATVTDGLLVGVIEKQSVSAGYVLQNLKEGVKFYTMASAFTIPAGKCYLLPSDASSKLSIAFEDETDGINDINANANDDVYDLQGRKLQNPQQRGIYIVNGKKVVKK